MQSRMKPVVIITSTAGTRPAPSARGSRRCAIAALQDAGELNADLALLVRREDGDDAVDGLGRVERVQRREHQVPGLGGEQRGLDGLVIAHLADQDHVGILTQRAAQRVRERLRVDRDLALVDDRMMVAVQVLDRVLDRHDVRRARRVDVVDHRRQRRALAAAGRAGHEDEAALFGRDPLEHRREAELVDRLDPHRDHAKDQADRAALLEDVDTEPADARDAVGEVDFLRLAELLALFGGEQKAGHRLGVGPIEPLFFGRDRQRAVHAHHRIAADLEVQVGRAAGDGRLEEVVYMHVLITCYGLRATCTCRRDVQRADADVQRATSNVQRPTSNVPTSNVQRPTCQRST